MVSGKGAFPGLPFDDGNYYSLKNKVIGFTGEDCFNYGGRIQFYNNLNNIYGIGFLNTSCGQGYSVDYNNSNTYSIIDITRNDNVIGGIIEGKINGKCSRCSGGSIDCTTRYFDYDISFKLLIVE